MGACAGMCYNALWYFPVLIVIGGITTVTWDLFARQKLAEMKRKIRQKETNPQRAAEESSQETAIPLQEQPSSKPGLQRRAVASRNDQTQPEQMSGDSEETAQSAPEVMDTRAHSIPVLWGVAIIAAFFGMFLVRLISQQKTN